MKGKSPLLVSHWLHSTLGHHFIFSNHVLHWAGDADHVYISNLQFQAAVSCHKHDTTPCCLPPELEVG